MSLCCNGTCVLSSFHSILLAAGLEDLVFLLCVFFFIFYLEFSMSYHLAIQSEHTGKSMENFTRKTSMGKYRR